MEAIVLLGAPGAGKGTAAARLDAGPGLRHVSTGQLCRDAMADHTPWGEAIRPYMDRGELIPDELALERVAELLRKGPRDQRILLDGFPRTLVQAEAFEAILAATGSRLTQVILLEVEPDTLVERLGARVGCPDCGTIYNLLSRPPTAPGRCDSCGAALSQRDDDRLATIRRRLRIYQEQTAPLIEYYEQRGLLQRVDAGASPDAVARQIQNRLDNHGRTHDQD